DGAEDGGRGVGGGFRNADRGSARGGGGVGGEDRLPQDPPPERDASFDAQPFDPQPDGQERHAFALEAPQLAQGGPRQGRHAQPRGRLPPPRNPLRAGPALPPAALLVLAGLGPEALAPEPDRLVVRRVDVALPSWPAGLDGLRIAALSDIHAGAPHV